MLDISSVKDVRLSVGKIFWADKEFYDSLPDRIFGTVQRWVNKQQGRITILWDDEEQEPLSLCDLIPCGLKLEPYADNRPAPRARRRRENIEARTAGAGSGDGAVQDDEQAEGGEEVGLQYRRGGRVKNISWQYTPPEGIRVDARRGERFRPKINRDKADFKTPYLMWLNVALPMRFMTRMFDSETGYINQRLSGRDNSAQHRKTTIGEGIRYLGYMFAMAANPGTPVKNMWQETEKPAEKRILPPPALGRFGMSENRFERLSHLVSKMFSVGEGELDDTDPWRYCHLPIDMHNQHWSDIYEASWLLAPDESMCPFDPEREGDNPDDIPFLSFVPRKPKPKGAELKDVADGESGVILFMELALKYKRKRNDQQVVPPYAEQPGKDTMEAQCLRLSKPWHKTGRAFGADAHFMSVASCEALVEQVRGGRPREERSRVAGRIILTHRACMLPQGLFPFGDVKQASSGFPVKELQTHCGEESGDWAVMRSKLDDDQQSPVFAIAHRRGASVSAYPVDSLYVDTSLKINHIRCTRTSQRMGQPCAAKISGTRTTSWRTARYPRQGSVRGSSTTGRRRSHTSTRTTVSVNSSWQSRRDSEPNPSHIDCLRLS